MNYELSDSSGTDDDLPPPHQNRFARAGPVVGNGRSAVAGPASFPRVHNDMETQIHLIEQEAYCSVLRAFKAQSDAITWEKESLITELRKELRVSDEEHRELLTRVNNDDMVKRLREWRKGNGLQHGMLSASQPLHDSVPSPTVSASRKKQKPSQSAASLSVGAPPPALPPSMQPSSSALKRGPPSGARGRKTKSSMQYPSTGLPGRSRAPDHSTSGAFPVNDPARATNVDPLVGRKVWTRWPEDNSFYEALITDYNPVQGQHALVYDMHTPKESWEWMNLKEMPPEDIRWEDPGIPNRGGRNGPGRGSKKPGARGGGAAGAGRGRGTSKGQHKRNLFLGQNGIGRKGPGDIELLHTDSLIKEVEKIFGSTHPDPTEVEKAKRVLKEHEQALVDAIGKLEDASDGESDGEPRFSQGQPVDKDRALKKRPYNKMAGEGRVVEGGNGDKMSWEGMAAPDKKQDGDSQ